MTNVDHDPPRLHAEDPPADPETYLLLFEAYKALEQARDAVSAAHDVAELAWGDSPAAWAKCTDDLIARLSVQLAAAAEKITQPFRAPPSDIWHFRADPAQGTLAWAVTGEVEVMEALRKFRCRLVQALRSLP
ncbi:hypothetical protein LTR53_004402 [Teratosphaeriaceae sp. CCFEE 6253]|nr:hypothetical protein LTR53_004402 [Teratosphaeriaceae sp. CCFEE 6253]